jgi:hypothetical protein
MTETRTANKMRRVTLAASILAIGILGIGAAAWLAGSGVSTWRELHSWYNPSVGFQSAALPVGFEDLVDRVKPTVVGVRAKVEQDADEDDLLAVVDPRTVPMCRWAAQARCSPVSPPLRGQVSSCHRTDTP